MFVIKYNKFSRFCLLDYMKDLTRLINNDYKTLQNVHHPYQKWSHDQPFQTDQSTSNNSALKKNLSLIINAHFIALNK